MRTIAETLDELELGPIVESGRLSIIPLRTRTTRTPDYVTLDEAIRARRFRITEVSNAGHVSELAVANTGDEPVLIVDGEELVGAKQNRIVNVTILVGPRSRLIIPVSCVEQGRWSDTEPDFVPAGRAHYASGRAMKGEHVTASMRAGGQRGSDQLAIWHDIAMKSSRFGADSSSRASSAIFDEARRQLDAFRAGIAARPGDVGAVFLIGRTPVGLELCDAPSTWRTLLPKLVESYGLEALDGDALDAASATDTARALIEALRHVRVDRFAGVGLGEELRFDSPDISGNALEWSDRVIHLAAFAKRSEPSLAQHTSGLLNRIISRVRFLRRTHPQRKEAR
jgi:hypothetical protein